MTPDSIGKKPEPGYSYVSPGPVEGAEGIVPPVGVPESGQPTLIRDQMAPSTEVAKKFALPPYDNPQAPIPTKKALKTMAVKREIEEKLAKGVPGQGMAREGSENPWMKYPARIAAVVIALFEFQKNMSATRFNEAQMQMDINTKTFGLGMENANLAKELKEIAASKEFLKAGQAFATAGTSIYQIGAIAQSRTKTKEKVENEGEYSKQIADQKQKIKDMKTDAATKNMQATDDPNILNNPQEIDKLVARNPKAEKAIKKEEAHLRDLERYQRDELQLASQNATTLIDLKAKVINSFSDGLFSIASGVYTKKEGSLEKEKAMLETLQQYLARLNDTISKAKDDAGSQVDKTLQVLAQFVSETKATLSTRG